MPTHVIVRLKPGESQESLLQRFKQGVNKSKVLVTVKNKRWFVSKSEQRRLEKKKAIRKTRRLLLLQRDK